MANPTGSNQVLTKIYESILNAIRVKVIGAVFPDGLSRVNAPARIDYTGTTVTTGAYVQLVASLSGATKAIHIFDSSGRALLLAVGGAGSEVDQIYIVPGGTDLVPLAIDAGSRVSVKAVDGNATKGQLLVSFLG